MHIPVSTLATLVAVLSLANPILASDLTCNGNRKCYYAENDVSNKLTMYIDKIDLARHYKQGERIACQSSRYGFLYIFQSHICAFVNNLQGASGAEILDCAFWIPLNDCKKCGFVPLNYPEGEDGGLVYDWVTTGVCRNGLC